MLWLISFPDSLRQIAIDDDSHELGFIEFSGLGNPQNYSRAEQSRKCQTGLAALTFASEQHRKAKSQAHDDACDDLVQVGENRHSRRDAALAVWSAFHITRLTSCWRRLCLWLLFDRVG